jgi:hypothetical protein
MPMGWDLKASTLIHNIGVQPNALQLIVRLRADYVSLSAPRNLKRREETVATQ